MPNYIEAGAIPIIAPQRKAAQLRESKMSAPTHSTNQGPRQTEDLGTNPSCLVWWAPSHFRLHLIRET